MIISCLLYVVHEKRIRKRFLTQTTCIPVLEVSSCLWCTRSSITAFIVVVWHRVLCCCCLSSVAVGFHCIDKFVVFIPQFIIWYLLSCLGYIHCCMVGWFYVMNPEGHERNWLWPLFEALLLNFMETSLISIRVDNFKTKNWIQNCLWLWSRHTNHWIWVSHDLCCGCLLHQLWYVVLFELTTLNVCMVTVSKLS